MKTTKRYKDLKEDLLKLISNDLRTTNYIYHELIKNEKYKYISYDTVKKYLKTLKEEGKIKSSNLNNWITIWNK